MRPMTPLPPSARCHHCGGELRLKTIEDAGPGIDMDVEIVTCVRCGFEQEITIAHDQHIPRPARRI